MQKADADPGGVGFGRGQPAVVLRLTWQVGLRDVIEERRCLSGNASRRDGVVGKRDPRRIWIVDGDRSPFLGGKAGKIALTLSVGGHGAVLTEGRAGPLAGSVEEDHILGVVLD